MSTVWLVSDMTVELPKDAEGREIPLDTVALYDDDGNVYSARRFIYTTDSDLNDKWINSWIAVVDDYKFANPEQMHLTTPDSWKKLEEDLDRCIKEGGLCAYYSPSGRCSTCILDKKDPCSCNSIVLEDIEKRIRKLRGED